MTDRPARRESWLLPETFAAFKRSLLEPRSPDPELRSAVAAVSPTDLYELGRVLHLPDDQVCRYLARFLEVPFLERLHAEQVLPGVLSGSFCHANLVAPLVDGRVVIANPFDWPLIDTLERTLWRGGTPNIALAEPDTIRTVTGPDDGDILQKDSGPAGVLSLESPEAPDDELEDQLERSSAATVGNEILRGAVRERASDVHFEPKERGTLIRYRIDGEMHDIRTLDRATAARVVSRLKVSAGMDIAERRKPQDGAVEASFDDRRFKLRLATSATSDGETLVVRILEPNLEPVPLEDLGFTEVQATELRALAAQQQGMILVVGPTGCGKSTTIFTLLSTVDGESRSIMSVEDPVEYRIPYANQQQVRERAGVTFESLLRSAMRQDPDILFLGEVRDRFSAQALLDFASSGHLTISSLHSSNATTAIFRLERLGLERSAMAEAISGVVSQKLLRKLCTSCREIGPITTQERELLEPFTDDIPAEVARAVGCPACRDTGYSGRLAVCEVIRFDTAISRMVQRGAPIAEIRAYLAAEGHYLIGDHALDRIRSRSIPVQEAYEQVLVEELQLQRAIDRKASLPSDSDPDEAETLSAAGPRTDEPTPDVGETVGSADQSGSAATTVLVVDDDPDLHALMELYLTGAGYRTVSAFDGMEGLMALARHEVDVVISDINMPNLDGVKLMEMITSQGLDVPAIFLTGDADVTLEEKVLSLGAADYMRKPVSKKVLLLRLERVLDRRVEPQAARSGTTT